MDTLTFYPNRQVGVIIGALGLALLLGLDVVFLLLLPQPPLSIANFLWGLLFTLSLPVIGLLSYGVFGVARSAYRLDRATLTVEWGARREIVPLGDIKEVLRGKEIVTDLRPRGLWWPGCIVGRLKSERLGEVEFLATRPQDAQVYVVTDNLTVAISPAALEEFVAALEERRGAAVSGGESGVTDEEGHRRVRRESIRPAIATWALWHDRWAWGLVSASAAGAAALFAFVLLRLPSLPGAMPLHFAADGLGTPDRIGAPRGLLILPMIGLLTLTVNSVLGGALHVREAQRATAYMLWGAALVVQLLAWIAVLGLIARA